MPTNTEEAVCRKYGVAFIELDKSKIVGVAANIDSERPLHGIRHSIEGDTTGWYLWGGEYSSRKDFFKPVHAKHLIESHPDLLPYLALPPGWRFLIDPERGYEDVWRDNNLLLLDE